MHIVATVGDDLWDQLCRPFPQRTRPVHIFESHRAGGPPSEGRRTGFFTMAIAFVVDIYVDMIYYDMSVLHKIERLVASAETTNCL